MYTSFFGLNEKPFAITPDPRYLFMSERHGEALAHLVYGVTESGGFVQLTGEVGTGKTTLVRTLLQNKLPNNADVAVVLNPRLSVVEFLETICEELHILAPENRGSVKALVDSLNHQLLKAHGEGRRVILVVDEAQNLSRDVLEQVRLLTNLETSKQKLLQIILIGQPELRDLLAREDLRQLAQRITGRYHLEPLSRDETAQYIEHRLRVAGGLGEVFESTAKREVYRLTQGVPRLINVICDRALLGAYSKETRRVNRRLVRRAAAEIEGIPYTSPLLRWAVPAVGAVAVAVIAASLWPLLEQRAEPVRAEPANMAVAGEGKVTPATDPAAVTAANTARDPEPQRATEPEALPEPEPEPESEPESESDAALDDQLLLAAELTQLGPAFEVLFGIWGLDFDEPVTSGCDMAESAGHACLIQRGSWSSLRQLDRPAILALTDSRGKKHHVVLEAVQGDRARLSIAGVSVTHSFMDVADLWFGDFIMLWRPPNGNALPLGRGSRSDNVIWLRESLAAIDDRYRAEPLDSANYDAELEQRVIEFQRDHRLLVDGLAGQQTQIIINSLLGSADTPRLTTSRLARD
jgi:general secretion pathway protein A